MKSFLHEYSSSFFVGIFPLARSNPPTVFLPLHADVCLSHRYWVLVWQYFLPGFPNSLVMTRLAPLPEHTFVMDYLSEYSQISGIFHKVLLTRTALSKVLWGRGRGAGIPFSFPKMLAPTFCFAF